MTGRADGFATAVEMLAALRARRVSAVELLRLHLDRIGRHNPRINALVIPAVEAAGRAAAAADAARARGGDAPLLGLPFTVKDAVEVAGLRATAGVPEHAGRVSTATAPVAARALGAGGVLLGKTNMPPWAQDWQADNAVFGRTNNPWDLDRTPGGSTGGGAAAVAAGLTPLELGSDLGGSVRVPAAWCGVYGHRPSETAVPQSGHFPGASTPNTAFTLGAIGPLARSAEDLALALDVVAGPEEDEAVAWRLELPPARTERLADLRVAVLPPVDWLPVRAELGAAQEELATKLANAGALVGVARPEGFDDLRPHHELLQTIFACINGARTAEARRAEAATFRAAAGPFAEARARGREAMAFEYVGLFARRERFRAAYRAFFREWDVLLTPLALTEAPPHSTVPMPERVIDVDGAPVMQWLMNVYPGLAVLSGQPATSFPVGLTAEGLPIGLQAIGPYLEDRTPIRFADLVAREFGGFRAPPGFA
jgi:amidase